MPVIPTDPWIRFRGEVATALKVREKAEELKSRLREERRLMLDEAFAVTLIRKNMLWLAEIESSLGEYSDRLRDEVQRQKTFEVAAIFAACRTALFDLHRDILGA